jgi:type IX secretion system PorP/SprF family membrane protein
MKKNILIIFLFYSLISVAQQDPLFTQNMFNQMYINPAYAGSNNMVCATALNRLQWVGFGDGSPMTTVVNINAAIQPFGLSSGVGLNIANDRFGFNQDLGVDLSYAIRFNVASGGKLAIGFNGGFINNTLDAGNWITPSGSTDNALPSTKENSINFDMGVGIFFNNDDMYFGASATHINEAKFNKAVDPSHYKRHYYITGGYILQMPSPAWQFNPSVFISSDLTTNQLSVTANAIYNKRFWCGVSYRVGEGVAGMIGFELFSGMRIGYAYDFSTTEISSYNSGSHEFMLGYCFSLKKEKPPQQYKSIRFL